MNFDERISRLNTASVKWELTKEIYGTDDVLPMWVADMDFKPPQELLDTIKARVDHGIFGYTFVPPSVHESISGWLKSRHGWEIRHSWILFANGVVPSISIAILAYTKPGDKVLIQPPVYNPFFEMTELNGRTVESSPLLLKNGRYEIDFTSFEESLKKGCRLFLLCNPHNPGGMVWTKEELKKMADLCVKHDCLILADEIHSDILLNGRRHIPIASLGKDIADRTITCVAPSKTFNLGGIQVSAAIITNSELRDKFHAVQKMQGFFAPNIFATIAIEAAYKHGAKWLASLIAYIEENVRISKEFIAESIPEIKLVEPEGTYLLWLDCRGLGLSDEALQERLIKKGKLALEPGAKYGHGGEGFVRMNIACPKEMLIDGLTRLKVALS
ncbi:pyridoxal phosphate-dependent aminotransferase [Neobacillus notoginsengisoli]|uniref:cysteine-S-conjugate beta-lyase n=1 Tax=Neobacillus notoginsengisoli TaxID=1578198 RepID=A0A417YXZ6_9BACI|nr:MalY/PatB family protein [Neobacillus notoginsengisoli]RHW42616.1 pyridoxal phosphate-dependent aminotransferase [Neobacillus notoginsengisoli]